MRRAAYRPNGTPRSASKDCAAAASAAMPAEVRSSRVTWEGSRTLSERTS